MRSEIDVLLTKYLKVNLGKALGVKWKAQLVAQSGCKGGGCAETLYLRRRASGTAGETLQLEHSMALHTASPYGLYCAHNALHPFHRVCPPGWGLMPLQAGAIMRIRMNVRCKQSRNHLSCHPIVLFLEVILLHRLRHVTCRVLIHSQEKAPHIDM